MSIEHALEILRQPPRSWPEGWQTWEPVRKAHWKLAHEFRAPPSPRFSGRGIIIAGGGPYNPGAYVSIRMLRSRNLNCKLPIQLWYLGGRGERDERYERLLAPYDVEFIDADAHPSRAARRILNGYELEIFAAKNSQFSEILVLDGDSHPCEDPTILFDEPRYRKSGGTYWPDMPATNEWTHWEHWGVEPFGPQCGLEVGQWVFNKELNWDVLNLAEFYDDHSDWCYGNGQFSDHGDKGPHRVSWAKLKRHYTMYHTNAMWNRCAFLQSGPSGQTMFVHRCGSKFTLENFEFTTSVQKGKNVRGGFPGEIQMFQYLEELRQALRKF